MARLGAAAAALSCSLLLATASNACVIPPQAPFDDLGKLVARSKSVLVGDVVAFKISDYHVEYSVRVVEPLLGKAKGTLTISSPLFWYPSPEWFVL
jgi:hypothetical protein